MVCLDYCMGVSLLGVIFLFYWGILTATGSELMYLQPKNKGDGAISLFFAAFVYALIFGICYYFKYYAKEGNDDVSRYIQRAQIKQQKQEGTELKDLNS
ncbi:hypothetical protein ABPG72_008731 [Tetrahymena utriculariae]